MKPGVPNEQQKPMLSMEGETYTATEKPGILKI